MLIYFKLFYFLGGLAPIIIGVLVLLKDSKKTLNKSFFLISLCGAVWSFCLFLMLNSNNFETAYFWRLLMDFGSILLPAFWIHFVYSLLNINKDKKKELAFFYLISAFLVVLNFLDLYYPGIFLRNLSSKYVFNYYPTAGVGYYFLFLFYILIIPYSLLNLVKAYLKSKGLKRLQLSYIVFAAFVGFLGGGTSFLLTFDIKFPPYGIVFFAFYPLIIGYAIARYRLMDVRLVVFRSLLFGAIILVVGSIFAVISTLITLVFSELAKIQSSIISGIIIAALFTLFYAPLRKFIEKATNSFLYKKSYDPDKLIAQITEISSSILDVKSLAVSITKTLNNAFHFQNIGIVLVDGQNNLQLVHQEGHKTEAVKKLLSFPGALDILNKEVKRVGSILVLDEMKTLYENDEFTPVSPKMLELLIRQDIAIIMPLFVKEHLIGMVALGNKKSGDAYNKQDLHVLKILAGQVAIAVENATLYDELKDFNIKLEEEVERKTAELKRANQELRQLDSAKSEFISIASHQLRTPLTVIKGYISMMLEGSFGKLSKTMSENLTKVYESNERLINLVENLLDISRIESGRQEYLWKKIHVENMAQTIVENLQNNAQKKGLQLTYHGPETVTPEIVADENKLHEVMMNFVDNAIKYTEKGTVDVYVKTEPTGMVTFCVKDTGKGIAPELKNQLFKKFSRGKDSFRLHTEGVGLGLYVAKMIIDAHEGKAWAESEGEGKGSLFCFSLPVKSSLKVSGDPEKLNRLEKTY